MLPALYLLAGASLYAAAHNLIAASRRGALTPHQLAVANLNALASGFGLAVALAAMGPNGPHSLAAQFSLGFGMGVFALLPWVVRGILSLQGRTLPVVISAGWGLLLLAALLLPAPIFYARLGGTTSVPVPLGSMLVQGAALLTISYALALAVRQYDRQDHSLSLILTTSLGLLLATGLYDLLVLARLLPGPFATAYGVLLFSIVTPFLNGSTRPSTRGPALEPVSYHLHLALGNTPAQRPERIAAEAAAPLPDHPSPSEPEKAPPRALTQEPARPLNLPMTTPTPATAEERPAEGMAETPIGGSSTLPRGPGTPEERNFQPIDPGVRGHLSDISVYANMILGRVQRGDTSPVALSVLARKLQDHVAELRRILGLEEDRSLAPRPGKEREVRTDR
jgi:hypothetical protein